MIGKANLLASYSNQMKIYKHILLLVNILSQNVAFVQLNSEFIESVNQSSENIYKYRDCFSFRKHSNQFDPVNSLSFS